VLLTYPFTDEVLNGVKGDYLNVYLDLTAVPGTELIPILTHDQNVYDPVPLRKSAPGAKKGSGGAATPRLPLQLPLPLPSVTTTGVR
jgi:phospholipid/cholesterol/gamma-HCH transport system substrate-binding protein